MIDASLMRKWLNTLPASIRDGTAARAVNDENIADFGIAR